MRNDHTGGVIAASVRRNIAVGQNRTLHPFAIDESAVGASTVDDVAAAVGVVK